MFKALLSTGWVSHHFVVVDLIFEPLVVVAMIVAKKILKENAPQFFEEEE